ncbi:hypothetical protein MHM84_11890 [Halomonas sp. McH1-25]|uniref:PA3496 family putative envelope integrity protein n=1 Tax=unclassified Halomonas TaxID=2609666 RepID=UPI001EF45BC2|nr:MULTISPECIES: hypothetical protein [unclassified Halomonas]MCG7600492.1 hypothetical protein [Halomonas sp. McH1-25]MCP1343552.1 hypothetical protein [Halomonas sp. FL8]MCP1359999.1 hypothetical protein [Halomonas sp. BBD45]MCP1365090.1 hypothetical protein [Halomonas sp. BBD48]
MSHETLVEEQLTDEQDFFDAVNDAQFSRSRSTRTDTLRVRRQVEALLEERRLKRAIEDDWLNEIDDEEEE